MNQNIEGECWSPAMQLWAYTIVSLSFIVSQRLAIAHSSQEQLLFYSEIIFHNFNAEEVDRQYGGAHGPER